jgi:predicted flavoprotein YhiN
VIAPKPALVPLALAPELLEPLKPLAGSTLDATAKFDHAGFRENVLITHRGLSGPAILQISSYWQMQEYRSGKKQPVAIDLLPGMDAADFPPPGCRPRRPREDAARVAGTLARRIEAERVDAAGSRAAPDADGEEVRVSTPVITASAMSKPRICRPKAGSASRIAATAKSGRQSARSVGVTPGL